MVNVALAKTADMLDLTSSIVAAYVSANPVPAADLPAVLRSVHSTLCGLGDGDSGPPVTSQKPAVPIKKSITPDYIVCLEDGKKLKMLKRYLRSNFKLNPDQYRAKWGLPRDYPMVAPNYAAKRSDIAKQTGLGHSKAAAHPKRKKRA
jgi:predicted transcriptional regulator